MTDPDKIDAMIGAENDPERRAFLLLLANINKSIENTNTALHAITHTVQEIGDKLESHIVKFETHTKQEDELLNKGRGAWKVVAWVIGVVQVAGLAIWMDSRQEIADIHITLHADQIDHARMTQRIDTLEKR